MPSPTAKRPDLSSFETASWGRRIAALLVDWLLCTLAVVLVFGLDEYTKAGSVASILVLPVYIVESTLLTWLAGGSIGKLLTGLCVVPADGHLHRLNPIKVLIRQIMIGLVIPPLVFRNDGRGLHDLAAGTSTVTFATLRTLVK
ncbi:RDD family protein [Pimelobacter simplex]|uniref:Putative membrane protein n=1 Tax=Nocardioides simplex TaxID=2045 RepID=A0A0A1DR28_NOCSI|nr:RDD family protein [Pimelobacter simplex]AIY17855.1 putative membrane protein [Pimelobacter simplex]GEB16855.1 RDD family protein [Pimelobacter simplex]SFM73639.1 RDD family protein [Pimelobacter simplex]